MEVMMMPNTGTRMISVSRNTKDELLDLADIYNQTSVFQYISRKGKRTLQEHVALLIRAWERQKPELIIQWMKDGIGHRSYRYKTWMLGRVAPVPDFTGRNLSGLLFYHAVLDGVDFTGCDLRSTRFNTCGLLEALMDPAIYDESTKFTNCFGHPETLPDVYRIRFDQMKWI